MSAREGSPGAYQPYLSPHWERKYLPCLWNSSGKEVILQAGKHLDLFPKPTIAALLVKGYTTEHINRKMFYTK